MITTGRMTTINNGVARLITKIVLIIEKKVTRNSFTERGISSSMV